MLKIKNIINKIPVELLVFLLAFLIRLPTLGRDIINNDAFLWKERGYNFGQALINLDFANTAVTYHPGVTFLYNLFIANKVFSLLNKIYYHGSLNTYELFLVNHQIQKIVLVFTTSILLALIYFFLKRITGKRVALLSVLLLIFEPFFIGLGRVVHTDALLSLFMFLAIITYYLSLSIESVNYEKDNWVKKGLYRKLITIFPNKIRKFLYLYRYIFVTSLFTGFALLTKSSALYLFGLYGLLLLHFLFVKSRKQSRIYYIKRYLMVVLLSAITFIIFWPAMWVIPMATLKYYLFKGVKGVALEEGHKQIWFGKETLNPGFWYYPVVIVARYTPFLVVTFLISIIYFVKNFKKENKNLRLFLSYILIFIFSYLAMLIIVSKKLDRYLLPVMFGMVIMSSYFLISILRNKLKLLLLGTMFLIVYRLLIFYGYHPNYLAYYSPLVGGLERGMYVVEPQWLMGYDEVAEYFNKKVKNNDDESVKVAIADYDYLKPFAKFKVLNIKHEVERDNADYFVLPVYRKKNNQFYYDNYELEKQDEYISVAGVRIYKIYKLEGKK